MSDVKVKALGRVLDRGTFYEPDDVFEVSEGDADRLVEGGHVELVGKRRGKVELADSAGD